MAKNTAAGHKNGHEDELHETEGSMVKGWPAMLLTVAMVAAAIYSFSPRSYPEFPATQIKSDGFLANGIAHQGEHYIAVGERGVVLYSTNPQGPWETAEVEPERSSTLTRVNFVDADAAIAVGHDGWIIRSTDAGKTWKEVRFDEQSSDPLLDVGGPYADNKLLVVGSFGQMLESGDLGVSWRKKELIINEQEDASAAEGEAAQDGDAEAADSDDDYDPFAAYAAGGGLQDVSSKHLNAIEQLDDDSLFISGESGLLLRSTDGGETWNQLDDIYDGSFYGALSTPDGGILVYGMRGNAFVSHDQGESWTASTIPVQQGLFQGAVTRDGDVLLVGASNTVLSSSDNGDSFELKSASGSPGLVGIIPLEGGGLLTAGEAGVDIKATSEASGKKQNNKNGERS